MLIWGMLIYSGAGVRTGADQAPFSRPPKESAPVACALPRLSHLALANMVSFRSKAALDGSTSTLPSGKTIVGTLCAP